MDANEQKDADDQMDANIHLKLVRLFLNIVGLWPYDHGWVNYLKRSAFMVITMSETVFQILGFMGEDKSRKNIINFIINISFNLTATFKFLGYLLNLDKMREMFDIVQAQRSRITDPEERKVIYVQDLDTMWWNRAFLINICLIAFLLTTYNILGMYFPNNLTDTIKVYYFPNNPKLSYFKLLHMYVSAIMPCSIVIGFNCTAVTAYLHGCGLFRLTKYRCEVAFNKSESISPVEQQKVESQNVRGIVETHIQGVEIIHYVHSTCTKTYFSTSSLTILASSMCMLRAYDYLVMQSNAHIQELLVHLSFVPLLLNSAFILHIIAQMCHDSSADIFWSAR